MVPAAPSLVTWSHPFVVSWQTRRISWSAFLGSQSRMVHPAAVVKSETPDWEPVCIARGTASVLTLHAMSGTRIRAAPKAIRSHQLDSSRTLARGDVPAAGAEAGLVPVVGRLGREGEERRDEERTEDHDVVKRLVKIKYDGKRKVVKGRAAQKPERKKRAREERREESPGPVRNPTSSRG